MPTFIDEFWLLTALSVVSTTTFLVIEIAGLVLALRRWRTGGLSARLAAAGFGLSILTTVGVYLAPFVWEAWNEVFITAYSTSDEYSIWPALIIQAIAGVGSFVSTALIVAALWTAWRQIDRLS